jgi:hypothetical protein
MSPKYRAILDDGDTTRERPLEIFGNDLSEIRRWAGVVLLKALDGGSVNIYQTIEQHVEIILKKRLEESAK